MKIKNIFNPFFIGTIFGIISISLGLLFWHFNILFYKIWFSICWIALYIGISTLIEKQEEEINDSNWEQMVIIPCPVKDCKGMLLNNIYSHKSKCSNCKKYFMEISEWKELEI